jgi:hypothetical protein
LARKTRIDTWPRGRKALILAFALSCSACASTPDSPWTAFQLGVFNPAQTSSEDTDIHGLRLNLPYGTNTNFRGIDLGMIGVTESGKGAQINFFYNEADQFTGLQLAGLPGNRCVDLGGVQVGATNTTEGRVKGWQLSFFSNEAGDVTGGQVSGIFNRARRVVGLQFAALVNDAEDLRGIQIGALNFNANGVFPFFPIFNFGFGSNPEEESTGDEDSNDSDE